MRIFTCTPVEFGGGADFFARDSGLLCRGFQSLGHESRAVMPGGRRPEDESDLIRTDYRNLESADWWRSHNLDGVVLYAWGRPRFRSVARAIHEAGVFLVLNQDSGGLASPLAGIREWLQEQWILGGQGGNLKAWLRYLKLTLRGLTAGLILTDPLRAVHLKQGDVVACVSPKAVERYRKLCRFYGGSLPNRVHLIPHAVEHRFTYAGESKERRIACIGRWQDQIQKRPRLLTQVLEALVGQDDLLKIDIVGDPTQELQDWHQSITEPARDRILLHGRMDRDDLADLLGRSRIFYSPSAFESFGIAAAEALCSGCSVVAGKNISLASFDWFVSEQSGELADPDTAAGHVGALQRELDQWDTRQRDPARIAGIWTRRLHAGRVAERIANSCLNRNFIA